MNRRKQIGHAVWLLVLLAQHVPAAWDGEQQAIVAGGNAVGDAELAERLEAKPRTIAAWRLRLKKCGVLDWLVRPGQGRVFYLGSTSKALGNQQLTAVQHCNAAVEPNKSAGIQDRNWVN